MAIYVFCVLAGNSLGNTNMSFMLDGHIVGIFARLALTDEEYGVLIHSDSLLATGPHELTIT